jgi:hypothetical protein
MKKYYLILFLNIIIFYSFSQNYSIKKRWTIACNYSLYKTWKKTQPFFMTEKQINDPNYIYHQLRSNIRLNVNYGISNCIEIGGYIGIMQYASLKMTSPLPPIIPDSVYFIDCQIEESQKLAPVFGVNINFHLFPLLITDPRCKWDLYVSAKYGGCYFYTYKFREYLKPTTFNYHKDELYAYRHEYGVGIGGSYFFENLVGFNTEFSVGQFSYWPRLVSSNFNLRAGIILKLNANRNKIYI